MSNQQNLQAQIESQAIINNELKNLHNLAKESNNQALSNDVQSISIITDRMLERLNIEIDKL